MGYLPISNLFDVPLYTRSKKIERWVRHILTYLVLYEFLDASPFREEMSSKKSSSPSSGTRAWPVMLYIPNLIGYFRIACMALSFYSACGCSSSPWACDVGGSDHRLAILLYLLNFAGDVVDGYAARMFKQGTEQKCAPISRDYLGAANSADLSFTT